MKITTIYKTDQFKLISHGNGWAYTFIDLDRMRSIWLQDSDAATFRDELDAAQDANPDATINAVLTHLWREYSDLAEPMVEPKNWPLIVSYSEMVRA